MKVGWQKLPFDKALVDKSGGNVKTPQSEFLSEGKFAVVDQGKQLVSGYVNDRARLCQSPLPVVVFGDHTRCIKFVDFPFCMGADGIKVLRPKVDAEVKYLFHFLSQLRLRDGGYDRHFKYLKRAEVLLPPLEEQRRIAEVLDRAEALRAMRRATLAQLDSLTQSIFLDLFGDPFRNPFDWATFLLSEVCETTQGVQIPREAQTEEAAKGYDRYLYINDFYSDDSPKFIEDKYPEKRVTNDDLVMANTGSPGRVFRGRPGILSNNLFKITFDTKRVSTLFFFHFLASDLFQHHLQAQMKKGIQSHLGHKTFGRQKLPIPPIELQREFARRVRAVEKLKVAQRTSLAELDALFATLQHRAFRGEL